MLHEATLRHCLLDSLCPLSDVKLSGPSLISSPKAERGQFLAMMKGMCKGRSMSIGLTWKLTRARAGGGDQSAAHRS
jgi:hypothetical protein